MGAYRAAGWLGLCLCCGVAQASRPGQTGKGLLQGWLQELFVGTGPRLGLSPVALHVIFMRCLVLCLFLRSPVGADTADALVVCNLMFFVFFFFK